MTQPEPTAVAIGRLAPQTSKPLLAAWMGGPAVENGQRILNDAGIPTYATPEEAIHAFMHLVSYTRNRQSLYETPRELALRPTMDREAVAERLENIDPGAKTLVLGEAASKQILAAYGVPIVETVEADSADEAIQAAERFGYPVALKVVSPQITHKSDVGGVALHLASADQVQEAYQRILQTVRQREPDAEVQGVTVQPMIQAEHAREMIVGAKQDETFGAVMMIGLGGTAAEVLQDRTLGLPPLNERLAREMLRSLRSWPLLEGYRGQPGVDLDALVEVLVRLSCLVADQPAIDSLDINPLLATPDGAKALDARVIVNRQRLGLRVPPYPHLAIRPYPEEFRQEVRLEDGTTVRFRPLRPSDAPRWQNLLERCSPESIRARFGHHLDPSHRAMAIRYCFLDYDRELAMVAEVGDDDQSELVGVGRLVTGPERTTAEYAVLVVDAWQNRGLGSRLTDACTRIARQWGVRELVAWVEQRNEPMFATFRQQDFVIEPGGQGGLVRVHKSL